jgi:hypothetical protein
MKLGTKLILAFLLLAVLPLTWIALYSYNSSITVFRKAVKTGDASLFLSRVSMSRYAEMSEIGRRPRFCIQQA